MLPLTMKKPKTTLKVTIHLNRFLLEATIPLSNRFIVEATGDAAILTQSLTFVRLIQASVDTRFGQASKEVSGSFSAMAVWVRVARDSDWCGQG